MTPDSKHEEEEKLKRRIIRELDHRASRLSPELGSHQLFSRT